MDCGRWTVGKVNRVGKVGKETVDGGRWTVDKVIRVGKERAKLWRGLES